MKLLILASLLILPSLSYAGLKCDSTVIKCAYGINPGTGCCKPKPHGHGGGNGHHQNAGDIKCDTSTLKCANGIDEKKCACNPK
jgi:hypothetical protein